MSAGTTLRRPLLSVAVVAIAAAGWGGLSRLGVVPGVGGGVVAEHGALMVGGFVGTLIALERAVAVGRPWANLAPALSAVGALALIVAIPAPLPALTVVAAALLFVAVTVRGAPTSPTLAVAVMTAGAGAWAVGALIWATGAPPVRSVPWWIAFLTLTIAAERLELSRALRPSRLAGAVFVALVTICAAGAAFTLADLGAGLRIGGAGTLGLAVWLGLRDRPPTSAPQSGLPGYVRLAISLAYGWLAIGGILLVTYDGIPAGFRWDGTLHALFVGFVLSMILAHGPIVLPAVLGVAIGYRRTIYAPLGVLQVAVVLRVAGDLMRIPAIRDAGGLASGVAVILFAAVMGRTVRSRADETRRALADASPTRSRRPPPAR